MSYVPREWKCGDVVTAEALNHIEQGIASGDGGGLIVSFDHFDDATSKEYYDRTWQEVYDAILAGKAVYIDWHDSVTLVGSNVNISNVAQMYNYGNSFMVYASYYDDLNSTMDSEVLYADSANGYLYYMSLT